MAFEKPEREYTFHIPQEELSEIEILAPLSKKQEAYLQDNESDIILFGGAASSGKSQLSLLRILSAGLYDKHYVAGIVRRSQRMIKGPGSLWSTFNKLSSPYGVTSNSIALSCKMPSGAEVVFNHLKDNQAAYQGTQVTEWLVDEAAQCDLDDVWYLTSRLRSKSKRKHQLRMTANPDKNSFLCEWLEKGGYLTEEGLPDPDMDGKRTWVIHIQGRFEFYQTKKEIEELYGKDTASFALSFCFYSANVYDNPWIRKHLPSYVHKLENMVKIERERLLLGNWFATVESSGYLKKDWIKEIPLSEVPLGLPTIRSWDLASSKPSEALPNPDWTRGVKCTYEKESGNFYILDMKGCRDRPAIVDQLIMKTAREDGREIYQGIPQDPGSSGRTVADAKRAKLLSQGSKCVIHRTNKSKLQRAENFLIAAQEGRVFVVKGTFGSEHWKELEAFDGTRSNNGEHDDIMDCLADSYNSLSKGSLIPTIRIGAPSNNRRLKNIGGATLL